jgi:hypothetical protein
MPLQITIYFFHSLFGRTFSLKSLEEEKAFCFHWSKLPVVGRLITLLLIAHFLTTKENN